MGKPVTRFDRLSVRFALVVAAIFGAALLALVVIQRTQRHSLGRLFVSETRERSEMVKRVVGLMTESLQDFAGDYSQWDEMVTFVREPKKVWASINLDASLHNFKLAAIWVLRTDGSLVYATQSDEPDVPPPLFPVSEADFRRLTARGEPTAFFVPTSERLLEVALAPVLPSADTERKSKPLGWTVAAREWNEDYLKRIADVVQCRLALAKPGEPRPKTGKNEILLEHTLRRADGTPAADLFGIIHALELEIVSRDQTIVLLLLAGAFLVTGAVAVFFVFRWAVHPIRVVGDTLESRDPRSLAPLLDRTDEIGRVAHAVRSSFEQRAALEEMIEGRTRLGRELHDGVIQTVFAAGMNLAGVRTVLRLNPAEAERILDDTRAELNTTIRNLRDFIQGLEPEPLQQRSFSEAVQSIVALMQGVRSFASTLHIDEELARGLNGEQRLHLLQIAREAVSNSVRHGQAKHVEIRLERAAPGFVLEIVDDGVGMERAPAGEGGRGLANFAARARELGGELHVSPAPGGGVRVRLSIPGPRPL